MVMTIVSPCKCLLFNIIITAIFLQIFALDNSHCMGGAKEPTAIVVDVETMEPIEGAVAIAIWRKHSIKEAAWFEGGMMVPVRIVEVVSDKEGKIYIEDFWDWHLFKNRYPRLTIYKPGYVCWDQKFIYINRFKSEKRQDFDKNNRIAKMKKWPEEFSFVGHRSFVDHVTMGDTHEASERLFRKFFDCEIPYRINERTERDEKRREIKKKTKMRRQK